MDGESRSAMTGFGVEAKECRLRPRKAPGSSACVRRNLIWPRDLTTCYPNANAAGHRLQLKEMEPSAATLGLTLMSLPVQTAGDIDSALPAATDGGAQAIITMDDPLIQTQRARIVAFALKQQLPVMGEFRPMTEAGAVMSYGPNQIEMWKHAGVFVDKILNGTNPADLPVEQPTKFELMINLKTAKVLGLILPQSLLVAADEVIE
jgi:putative tryptophan/tyrosine transport system substrate-binding protein